MDIVGQFLSLHEMDWEMYLLRQEQEMLPQKLQRRRRELEGDTNRLAQSEAEGKKEIVNLREQEKALAELDLAIEKKGEQLNKAKDNREYETLKQEIAEKKRQKEIAEEKILKLIEQNEQNQRERGKQKEQIAQLEKEHVDYGKEIQGTLKDIAERLQKLQKKREKQREVVHQAAPELFEKYERIVNSKTGKALVSVEDEACGFCYVQLTANEVSALYAGKMIFCKNCERLLYVRASQINFSG